MENRFPVGFYDFSKDEGLNFQLNRFYATGALTYDELMEIGRKITGFDVWISLFTQLAQQAEQEGNAMKAAVCYRAAQFYTLGDTLDENGALLKLALYEKCFATYEQAFKGIEGLVYERIPYRNGYLPVYVIKGTQGAKGSIVMHGGYDSFMQEFLGYGLYLRDKGYDVYFFEGPGQGEVLCRCGIRMTHEWEHCVKAVLDHYKLDDVTLIGISLGGYLATRAAAYEPRVKRLIMFDLIYDFYGSLRAKMSKTGAKLLDHLTAHPKSPLWKLTQKKMEKVYFLKWLFGQGYHIFEGVHTPCEYFNHIKLYNTREISQRVTQDTLVLAGEKDIYTVYLQQQLAALTNARSVESRLFTAAEHADHHCQIGNAALVLDVMADWIERVQHHA